LRNALGEPDYSALFRMTEAYRAGAEGQEKTSALLMALHLLLRDLMVMKHGQTLLVRNVDLERQLHAMAESVEFSWIEASVRSIDEVQTGMRRNLLRSLSLDAMAGSLSATFSKA
jgi:DNA polymerase-3 subunit delta'